MIQWILAIWSLAPLPLQNPAYTSGSSWFIYYWILAWRFLSITLLACEMGAIVWNLGYSLTLPFFGSGFQSYGHCCIFQIYWLIESRTLTALSLRILNSSTGIRSPPLALFIVMLPKAYFTLWNVDHALSELFIMPIHLEQPSMDVS